MPRFCCTARSVAWARSEASEAPGLATAHYSRRAATSREETGRIRREELMKRKQGSGPIHSEQGRSGSKRGPAVTATWHVDSESIVALLLAQPDRSISPNLLKRIVTGSQYSRREIDRLRRSGRRPEPGRLHNASRPDECEDGGDEMLGERRSGVAKACESGVNRANRCRGAQQRHCQGED